MRLLKVSNSPGSDEIDIALCDINHETVDYAILSHTWGEEEVSYYDFTNQRHLARQKNGYDKIIACCRQALSDELSYVWIDTCCIDKASSAELTESINSMYRWYEQAQICYTYLGDVRGQDADELSSSRWFTRGWTLQEMIAPTELKFFATDWTEIGRKTELAKILSEITKVPEEILLHQEALDSVCVSQKMYWASKRQTTRIEDRAYSLIGLFNISLPIIYGEGCRAFRRLQEEIIRITFDHTIFVWELSTTCSGLLASSPDVFAASGEVKKMPIARYVKLFYMKDHHINYSVTNLGLEIQMPHLTLGDRLQLYVGCLACFLSDERKPISLYLRRDFRNLSNHFFRTRVSSRSFLRSIEIPSLFIPQLSKQPKIMIIEPDKALRKMIRDPVPDELLNTDKVDDQEATYCMVSVFARNISLQFRGRISAAYPMPQIISEQPWQSEIIFEAKSEEIWVISITYKPALTLFLLLVIIDNNLICHLEHESSYHITSYDSSNTARYFNSIYQKCRSSPKLPCTEIVQRTDGSISNDTKLLSENDVVIWLYQLTGHHPTRPCKEFQVFLMESTAQRYSVKETKASESITSKLEKYESPESSQSLQEILARCKPLATDVV